MARRPAGRADRHQRGRNGRALEPGRAGTARLRPAADPGPQHRRPPPSRSRPQSGPLPLGGRGHRAGRDGHGDRLAPRRASPRSGDLGLPGVRPAARHGDRPGLRRRRPRGTAHPGVLGGVGRPVRPLARRHRDPRHATAVPPGQRRSRSHERAAGVGARGTPPGRDPPGGERPRDGGGHAAGAGDRTAGPGPPPGRQDTCRARPRPGVVVLLRTGGGPRPHADRRHRLPRRHHRAAARPGRSRSGAAPRRDAQRGQHPRRLQPRPGTHRAGTGRPLRAAPRRCRHRRRPGRARAGRRAG